MAGELCLREPRGAQDLSACLRGCCLACVSQQEVLGRVNYSLNQVAQSPRAFWKLKVRDVSLPGSSVGGKVGVGQAKRCVWRGSEHVGGIFGGFMGFSGLAGTHTRSWSSVVGDLAGNHADIVSLIKNTPLLLISHK